MLVVMAIATVGNAAAVAAAPAAAFVIAVPVVAAVRAAAQRMLPARLMALGLHARRQKYMHCNRTVSIDTLWLYIVSRTAKHMSCASDAYTTGAQHPPYVCRRVTSQP